MSARISLEVDPTNLQDVENNIKKSRVFRNMRSISSPASAAPGVILEWWHKRKNVGDALSPLIVSWMKEQLGLGEPRDPKRRIHLMAVGSLIGMQDFDAVIWGSGLHCLDTVTKLNAHRDYVRYDIRAVRGPITAFLLRSAGYDCPEVYGDPAILMPLIYKSAVTEKKYPVSVICHIDSAEAKVQDGLHQISAADDDIGKFIDEITASELVISSSLHGIILSEVYGVPAVYLAEGTENQRMKYYDWYFSTGRYSVRAAANIEEALKAQPMPIPDFAAMREAIMRAFPSDLYRKG